MIGSVASKIMWRLKACRNHAARGERATAGPKGALAETPEEGAFTADLFSNEAKKTFTLNEVLRAMRW